MKINNKQVITKPKSFFLLSMVLFMLVGTATMSYATSIVDFSITPRVLSEHSVSGTFSLEFDAGGMPIAITSAAISHSNSAGSFLFTVPPSASNFLATSFLLENSGSQLAIGSTSFSSGMPLPIPFSKSGGSIAFSRRDPGQTSAFGAVTSYAPVPEPGTVLLLSTGLLGLAGYRWQQRQRHERQKG